MAGADETDGGDKEVVEVEPLVRLVLGLDYHPVKVLQDHGNIWEKKIISLISTDDSSYQYL